MKITKTNNRFSTKKLLIAAGAILIIASGVVATMAAYKVGPFTPLPATESQNNSAADKQLDKSSDKQDDTLPGDTPVTSPKTPVDNQPVDNGNTKDTLEASITAANQNGSTLQIRTLIEKVSASGTCTLKISKGAKTVTKTSDTQALSSASTCMGFDIPTSELSKGEWSLVITITIGDKKATLNKTVTIS
jgi:hypothetical protein